MERAVRLLCVALSAVILYGCGDFKPHPVTWEDIARTIPADPEYVVSVNTTFEADSALNDIWAKEDVLSLIGTGLALDSVRPDHFVVVALPKATFVTWPLPNPRAVAEKVGEWNIASLNNTDDAHILVRGKASLVVSSTQAWVVNNVHGEKFVNEILQEAMNTKALHTVPFAECIIGTPAAVNAVIPYEGKYYDIEINHESGLLRVDVDAFDKNGRQLDIIDGLGRLPIEFIDQASPYSPFAAVEVERGTMPSLLKRVAKLLGDLHLQLGVRMISSAFNDVAGTVLARWNSDALEVKIPYVSTDAAHVAEHSIKSVLKKTDAHYNVALRRDTLIISRNIGMGFYPYDADHTTPHRYSETENPSAVAFARVDLEKNDRADLYFELAPTHARLQVDFHDDKVNLPKAVELVKKIIFRVL